MDKTLFLVFAVLTVLPGMLIVIGAARFKKLVQQPAGVLLVIGASLILVHLFTQAGTYYHSFLGDAQSLADYSLNMAWLGPVSQYIGLILIAAGLFIFKKK